MNDISPRNSETADPEISLRPEQPGDDPFLFDLYAGTRADELALAGWDDTTRAMFLTMQFKAMRQGYATAFPAAEFLIVERAGRPVGRMVRHRGNEEIRVVDLAVLPAHRNRGIGTFLLQGVCAEAAEAGKPIRLSVLKSNRAIRWYERLGFAKIGEDGLYLEMEWRP